MLIDSGNMDNLIDKILVEYLNCFIYPMKNYEILITNKGSIHCVGK